MSIRVLENNRTTYINYSKYSRPIKTLEEINNDEIIFYGTRGAVYMAEEIANGLFEISKYGEEGERIVFLEDILKIVFCVRVELDKPYYYEEGERIEFDWELVALKSGPVFTVPAYVIRFHPTHY